MLPNTLTARSYRFAFLFSGQPEMKRDQNIRFYDSLTAEGIDFPTFEQRKNEIVLQNVVSGTLPRANARCVTVGHFKDKFRLFVLEDYPEGSMKIFQEITDSAWKVFSDVWKPSVLGLSLAEATLRYTAAAKGGNATSFLLGNCMKIPKDALVALGRDLQGVGLKLVSPVLVAPEGKQPLSNADFNISIETLLEDPSRMYIQITVKWLSLPLPAARGPVGQLKNMPTFLNPECRNPSWYLGQAESFVTEQVQKFLCSV